uniref:Endonuclease/exonuclease/phosphatase domain-containing protein n=1 Tax=Chenopodium quinoa TaxID=63459 RepID=A0A803LIY6_CHEQI
MALLLVMHEIHDFSEFITTYNLTVIKSIGHYYSWHKGDASTNTASRIDWCLGNTERMMIKGDIVAEYLSISISDHSPILVECIHNAPGGGRPFKFFDYPADHKEFLPIVNECWSNEVASSAIFSVWSRLKMIKGKLKSLHKEEFKGISEKIKIARADLNTIQSQLHSDYSNFDLLQQERNNVAILKKWLKIEETTLRKKSRLQWLHTRDFNHHFFYSSVKERHRVNRISIIYN